MSIFREKFPILNISNKIHLRELSVADAENFYNYYINPKVHQYIPSDIPKNKKESQEEVFFWKSLFNRGCGIYWGIVEKTSEKLIGMIGLNKMSLENKRAELSYELSQDYWGRGIMSSAIRKVSDFSFNKMGLNRIEAMTSPKNLASCKVLEKNRFIREGILREYRYSKEQYYDMAIYSLVKGEFKK